jgi:M6 family metalloprotease-like protein
MAGFVGRIGKYGFSKSGKGSLSHSFFVMKITTLLGAVAPVALAHFPAELPMPMPSHASRVPPPRSKSIEAPVPTTGDQKILVLIVDFPDKRGSFSGSTWGDFFWGEEPSFMDYFAEVSHGALSYSGDIVGFRGGNQVVQNDDIAAGEYITLNQNITYYADNQYGFGYGSRSNSGVVRDAVEMLDGNGFDFGPYADHSGYVSNLLIVYSGQSFGYAQDARNSLEATAYRLRFDNQTYTSRRGFRFDDYTFCPENTQDQGRVANIGICVHEQGHALGMSDMYDYSYTTSGAGVYDLMAFGTYGADNSGRIPYHPSPFTKSFFNWTVHDTATVSGRYRLLPNEVAGRGLTLVVPGGRSSEYFLLENKRPVGYNRFMENGVVCPGVYLWHIDEAVVQNYPYGMNSIPSYYLAGPNQGVVLVEASGRKDLSSPPMYQGSCRDAFQVGSAASSLTLWSGAAADIAFDVMDMLEDGSVFVDVTFGESPPPVPGCADDNANCTYWASVGECSNNSGYMELFCQLSCGLCN